MIKVITMIKPSTVIVPTESKRGPTRVVLDIECLFCFDNLLELKFHFDVHVTWSTFTPGEGRVVNKEHGNLLPCIHDIQRGL